MRSDRAAGVSEPKVRPRTLDEIRDVWLANRGADGSNWETALGAVYDLGAMDAGRGVGRCVVRMAGLTDPPQDCDWPTCGCDQGALELMDALREAGWSEPNASKNCPLITGLRPCECNLPRCPKCGYTEHDAEFEGDHFLCDGRIPGQQQEPTP